MKTYYKETLAWIALVSAIILFSFTISFAQNNTEGSVRIHIEKEVNGNTEKFDTTFTSTGDYSADGIIIPHQFIVPVPAPPPNPFPRPYPIKPLPPVDTITVFINGNKAAGIIEDDHNNFKNEIELSDEEMKLSEGEKYSLIIKDEEAPAPEKKVENDGREIYMYKRIITIDKTEDVTPGTKNGVENILELTDFKIYPNPTDGQFNLSFHLNMKGDLFVKLIDISGKELFMQKYDDFSGVYNNVFDMSDKGKGIYILSIEQNNKLLTKKIVIN